MSEVKVNKITPRTDCGTTQLGDSGDTVTVTGDLRSNSLKAADGGVIISQSGTTITLGASGDTISLASGASQTGFGRTGTVNWDTTVKTAIFTATSGSGFFVDTSSGAVTVTLPASPSAGDIVSIADYAGTSATNKITIARNGSNMEGAASNSQIETNRTAVTLIFADSTQGWLPVNDQTGSKLDPAFVAATGGTVVTCGNFKTHVFTGPGTFCVSCAGNTVGSNTVDYFVLAGGGGGGRDGFGAPRVGGGGGGGGFRVSNSVGCVPSGSMSPLANSTGLPVAASPYPITVGGGGTGGTPSPFSGGRGSNSIFAGSSTITSTGGGGGQGHQPSAGAPGCGTPGGSGGGVQASVPNPANTGEGNTPSVSPPQGNDAGDGGSAPQYAGGGGGGAGAKGGNQSGSTGGSGGVGGIIGPSFIGPTAPSYGTSGPATGRYFAGGGGSNPGGSGGSGGGASGSGGAGGPANTGGGGGGNRGGNGGAGASGIVMIRYKFQ